MASTLSRGYPAMMQICQSFDPGFFDLIVADESHRSIYNIYRDIFDWFDGLQVGLTATPVEMVSRSTCSLFDCDFRQPDFSYSYEEAIDSAPPYLVPFEVYTHTTKFLREGVHGPRLTDEQIAQLDDQGIDPQSLDFDSKDIDRACADAQSRYDRFLRSSVMPSARTFPPGSC